MKFKRYISYPTKITIAICAFFTTLFAVVSIMFFHTGNMMENEAIKHIEFNTAEISNGIDETILNVYSVSDAFALDERLQEYTDGYAGNALIEKRFITTQISNVLFASYDLLRKNEKMAAFYNTTNDEVFNFLDPNADEEICKKHLKAMNINAPEKLAKFYWYPVRDNFLRNDKTGDLRRDKAIIGSRRIFSRLENAYLGVHIFALDEEEIYEKYSDILSQYDSEVFIMNEEGALLSTSSIDVLMDGYMEPRLAELVLNREYDRFTYNGKIIFVKSSEVNDWLTVVCVPEGSLSDVVDKLHGWIFIVLIAFAVVSCVLMFVLYRSFMKPISLLNDSMRRVHDGDLNAYVDFNLNNELGNMIKYYNSMLESINYNLNERLHMEQHKRQLEMDILMNQINPHFLYNTLETIVWKSSEAGHPDIGRLAASLGRMYRLSISGGRLFISLSQELEHVNAFIRIQESRYEDSFSFEMNADQTQLHEYYTLKILLQPIVENSLSHGMEGLNRTLRIRLSVKILADSLLIRITDTGAGMDAVKLSRVRRQILTGAKDKTSENISRRKSTGIGMHNIYERLKIYFGNKASISIWSKKNIGTVITLELPIISREEAEALNENLK